MSGERLLPGRESWGDASGEFRMPSRVLRPRFGATVAFRRIVGLEKRPGRLFEQRFKGETGPVLSLLDPKSSASGYRGGGQSYRRPSLVWLT